MSSYLARAKAMLQSKDPAVVAAVKAANQHLIQMKMLSPGAVHNNGTLASLSVQYANEAYIGLQLCPVKMVSKMSDTFFKMGKRDRRAVPNAEVGAMGTVNQPNAESRSTDTYSCQGYALKDYVDEMTLKNQDAPLNEMLDLVASLNDLIELNTEMKIATLMTTSSNYASGNTVTLSGTSQWSNGTASTPISDIQTAIDACEVGPGATKLVGFCGVEVARALQRHPSILELFKYTGQGLVPMDMIAKWFGLDAILVGKARKDTANLGQTASYSRVWPKYFGVARVAENPGPRTACFGLTFRFGEKVTDQWFDKAPGVAGGYWAKVGVVDDYKCIANDTGYLIVDAVA